MITQVIVMIVVPLAAYLLLVVRPNLKKAKALRDMEPLSEEQTKYAKSIKHSLSEAPTYLRITQSTFMSIDMTVEANKELFRTITLFYKALFKESTEWRNSVGKDYSQYFHLDEHHSHTLNNLIPALDIIKDDFIKLQENKSKLKEMDDCLVHEINLMKTVSEQLEYGVPATNPTILEAISKIVLGIVFHEKELNKTALSELEEELALYDNLTTRNKIDSSAVNSYEDMYKALNEDFESAKETNNNMLN